MPHHHNHIHMFPNQSYCLVSSLKAPSVSENCLTIILRLDLPLPPSALNHKNHVLPPPSHFQKLILLSKVPTRPGQPFIVRWRSYLHLSKVTQSFRLHQPNTQSPGQLPTSLEFSLLRLPLIWLHFFIQKKEDLYRTFRSNRKSSIRSKMNNIESWQRVLSLKKKKPPSFPFRLSIILLFPWTPWLPLTSIQQPNIVNSSRDAFSLCYIPWGFLGCIRRQMFSGWRAFVSSSPERIPKRAI